MDDADDFGRKVAAAISRVVVDYRIGDVVHEEPFSDQLCGRLKETLHDFRTRNFAWQTDVAMAETGGARLRARTLTKTSEEPVFGADIVMALDITSADYSVQKGFLAQAKRLEPSGTLPNAEHRRLLEQCERMLALTPASMVFLYSASGVRVIPAVAVMATRKYDLWNIATYNIETLFRDFALCWFGDPRIQATDHISLEGLRAILAVPSAARFIGRGLTESGG